MSGVTFVPTVFLASTPAPWSCPGCGSQEYDAHWPNCRNSTTGSRTLGMTP